MTFLMLHGVAVAGLDGRSAETLVHIVMAPQALEEAKGMSQAMGQLRRVTVEEAASTFSKVKRGVNLDAKLGGISLVFEILNYLNAQDAVEKADRFAEPEAKAGLTATIFGRLSAVSDVNAASIKVVHGAQWAGGSALGAKKVFGGLKISGGLFALLGTYAGLIGFVVALTVLWFEDEPIAKWMERTVRGRKPSEQHHRDLKEELQEPSKLVEVKRT